MSKKRAMWNEATYRRYIAEGRGQGVLEEYKPWIVIQDFPSRGIVSRIQGITTGRVHHLMSNLELYYFYILDWSQRTIDIREQFPLVDLQDAMEIADKIGVKYPVDKRSGFPYVLTSDFLVTTNQGIVVRSVKLSGELKKLRVREKLEIERQYWEKRGIEWRLVTEHEISMLKAKNIEWLLSGEQLSQLISDEDVMKRSLCRFLELYGADDIPFSQILEIIEKEYRLERGGGIAIFKKLVTDRRIPLDISRKIDLSDPRK